MDELLVQFRIPRGYAPKIKAAAEGLGISSTAWLRQLVMRALGTGIMPTIQAWALKSEAAHLAVLDVQQKPSSLFLAQVEQTKPTERTFRVLVRSSSGPPRPANVAGLKAHKVDWFIDLQGYKFVLAPGSVWRPIVALEFDRGNGPALEITMELEKP
jgi:hypothetical protein